MSTHRASRPVAAAVAAALALIPVARVAAQSAAQRVALEQFRDSLAIANDSVVLLGREKQMIAFARTAGRDSAMVHLRLGFLDLRLGDLAGKQHFEDAASEFQWANDIEPKWPYPWFGLGFAELGVGDAAFAVLRGLQAALGKDALTKSANDFAHSAEVDPGFVRGLVELTNTALRQRVNLRMDVALAALRRASATPAARQPEILLARARIEREVGSPDSARAAVDALVAMQPANAQAQLEQARVRFKLRHLDGGDPWYRGLDLADAATTALYRADLLFVLPDSTLRTFDASTPAARVSLMRRFWTTRDRDALRAPGERLMEHYRRLDFARHNYRLATTHRHYDIVERYRPPVAEFDDRGVIYIRQGEPDDRASLDQPGIALNESWVYHRPGESDLLFHFVAREGVTDFRLVESALDVLGYSNAVRLENSGDLHGTDIPPNVSVPGRTVRITADSADKLRQLGSDAVVSQKANAIVRSRQSLDPVYQRMLAAGRGSASGIEAEERQLGKRSIRVGTSTDAWPRNYRTTLPAAVQVLAVGGDSTSAVLQLLYAIPVSDAGQGGRGGIPFAPHLRASVMALDGSTLAVVDTAVSLTPPQRVGKQGYVMGRFPLDVRGDSATVRVGIENERAGIVSDRDTVQIASPARADLGLSDLVLGTRGTGVGWPVVAGDTVWSDPVAEFRPADVMQLYFEITGIGRDTSYRVELTVQRPGKPSIFQRLAGGGAAIKIGFSGRSAGLIGRIHRELALDKLRAGRYVMEVTVTSVNGEKRVRRQDFTVVP